MKVAVLTFHRAFNCGALLQAWALRRILEEMGHEVVFPDANWVGVQPRFVRIVFKRPLMRFLRSVAFRSLNNLLACLGLDGSRRGYERFRRRFLGVGVACGGQAWERDCDCVIVGSDQVWNPALAGPWWPLFLGETLPEGKPRIAYAASAGDQALDEAHSRQLTRALRRFCAVSVREETLQKRLRTAGFRGAQVVPDPTCLLRAEDYAALDRPLKRRGRTMVVYAVGLSPGLRTLACALAKRVGARVRFMPCNQAPIQQLRPDTLVASPDRLVAELRQADYVLTHSFHGTVLSILFRRPFLAFREVEEPAHPSRTRLLLERFGLGERLVTTQMAGDVEASLRRLLAPLPDLDEPLAALRKQGLDFLRTALEAAKVR